MSAFCWAFKGNGSVITVAIRAFYGGGLAIPIIVAPSCTLGAHLFCFFALVCAVAELITLVALGDWEVFFYVNIV